MLAAGLALFAASASADRIVWKDGSVWEKAVVASVKITPDGKASCLVTSGPSTGLPNWLTDFSEIRIDHTINLVRPLVGKSTETTRPAKMGDVSATTKTATDRSPQVAIFPNLSDRKVEDQNLLSPFNDAEDNSAGQPDSLEYKLACINAGRLVSKDDLTVARFRALLDSLAKRFRESPRQIGNISVAAQLSLKGKGISESLLNIMEGMNYVMIADIGNQSYAEYTAIYVTLRASSFSHERAAQSLQDLLSALLDLSAQQRAARR